MSTHPHRLGSCALLLLALAARAPLRSAAAPAPGILIASESFDYPARTALGKADGGTGWNGGWMTSPLQPADNRIAAPGMVLASRPAAGGKLATAATGASTSTMAWLTRHSSRTATSARTSDSRWATATAPRPGA